MRVYARFCEKGFGQKAKNTFFTMGENLQIKTFPQNSKKLNKNKVEFKNIFKLKNKRKSL